MSVAERITDKLNRGLRPIELRVIDESHRHAGHIGARPEGESHFQIEVVSESFTGLARLDRHRLVHQLLADELAGPVHALSLWMRTPAEANTAAAPGGGDPAAT